MEMPPDYWEAPQNLCEQPLINALGRVMLGRSVDDLKIDDADRVKITALLRPLPAASVEACLSSAMEQLTKELALSSPTAAYAAVLTRLLLPRLLAALPGTALHWIFL